MNKCDTCIRPYTNTCDLNSLGIKATACALSGHRAWRPKERALEALECGKQMVEAELARVGALKE